MQAMKTTRCGLAVAVMTVASGILSAQSGGLYGGGPTWWDASQRVLFPWQENYENADGEVSILNKNGAIHTDGHAFFEPLGSNRRACITCHQPSDGMSLSTATLRERWSTTEGRDPIFAAVDGSNCPGLPQSEARSHSLLLDRGLIRIALPWPPKDADGAPIKPEFRIEVVRDPTGCNLSAAYGLKSGTPVISVFRRPRITANFKYVVNGEDGNNLMADGREPSLRAQAIEAALTHEQAGAPPTAQQLRQIVDFEMQVFAAQYSDVRGGLVTEKQGPLLGTDNLAGGGTGSLGEDSAERVILSFAAWRKQPGEGNLGSQREFRASAGRGSEVFFTRRFRMRDASASTMYTCASCHSAGSRKWLDIGTTNVTPEKASPDLPLFRITCDASAPAHPIWGRVFYTQDPGRALISGKCADAGAIVPQQLRALAARAPYFSNGSAQTLREVVEFYDRRFGIGLSEQEKQDLINFLRVL